MKKQINKNYSINEVKALSGVGILKTSIGEVSTREEVPAYFEGKGYKVIQFEMDPDGFDAADIAVMKGGIMDCYSVDAK